VHFVVASPLDARMGHFTEGIVATGNGRLALKLDLPLGNPEANTIAGEFTFGNVHLQFPGMPSLAQLDGKVAFTEGGLQARDLAAQIFGSPVTISLVGTEGRLRVTGAGMANLVSLRREYGTAYLDGLSGNTDWTVAVNLGPGLSTWALESSMKGAVVDLPAPLGKLAAEVVPLRIERQADIERPNEDRIEVTYGRAVQLAAHRKLSGDSMSLDRALLSLGRAAGRADAARAERPGLWVRAELPSLNIDDWLAVRERRKQAAALNADDDLALAGVDLDIGNFEALGRRFNELKVVARQSSNEWRLDLSGRDIAGSATWSAPGSSMPNGRIVARLARLGMPLAGDLVPWSGADKVPDSKTAPAAASPWPELDISAEGFSSKGRELGQLEVIAHPRGAEWRIEKLRLSNESGRIDADGAWRTVGRQQQTKLDVALDANDAGGFLTRFGYPGALQGAPTRINGQLAWAGAPSEFDYPTLNGAFRIAVGPGRFTKIEPGIGKLLGVLSLQALPRRISLDFQDIFSDGFAFDEVNGNVRVVDGVMNSGDLRLVGPAASVDISGDADLARETQRLTVRVQPSLSTSVSAGAALLFLANPIIGAAVGAGSLLAQKVFKDPIEQLFSYQYTVTGGWSDPVVTRSGTATASVAPGTQPAPVEGIPK
jgi:uncharacterized protein (TIGR02099 family)